MKTISVIGAGAWGTALAQAVATKGTPVALWARENEVVESINTSHENTLYLPGIALSENINATNNLSNAIESDVLLLVTPAQHMRSTLETIKDELSSETILIICAKGIELDSGKLLSQIVEEVCPNNLLGILTGPTFAAEVANGLPVAMTLAMTDQEKAAKLQSFIGSPTVRPYISDDVIGSQIAGAVKNVMAIACGILHSCAMGENARAALITRGLAEITRLGTSLGARQETFLGLSGLGDLILTCSSMQSRNFSLGAALGEGKTMEDIMAARNSVAEGVHTAKAVCTLASAHNIDMPIAKAVNDILNNGVSIDAAVENILKRPFTQETL